MTVKNLLLQEGKYSKIALVGFLLTLSLPLRKVFFVFSPDRSGLFNEYTDISLYLSDLTFLIFIGIVILEYKSTLLSISFWKKMFHVEQRNLVLLPLLFFCWSGLSIFWSKNEYLAIYGFFKVLEGLLLYLGLYILLVPRGTIEKSVVKKENCSTWNNFEKFGKEDIRNQMFHVEQSEIEYLSSDSQYVNVSRGTISNQYPNQCSTWNIWRVIFDALIFSGVAQSIIGIMQFIGQKSVGLTFLQETKIGADLPGIAKVFLLDKAIVRSYGLFTHPNVLAGFLGITILATLAYPLLFGKKMFHVEQLEIGIKNSGSVPRGTIISYSSMFFGKLVSKFKNICSTWNIYYIKNGLEKMFHVEHLSFGYRIALFIEASDFLLTFSKSAFFSLFIVILYLVYEMFHVEQLSNESKNSDRLQIVPRGTITSNNFLKLFLKKCSTWNILATPERFRQMFHVEQLKKVALIGSLALFAGFLIHGLNWQYFVIQPWQERLFYDEGWVRVLQSRPLQGLGISQSVFAMQTFFQERLLSWQYQPVHNIYLEIIEELGLAGFIFFIIFILSLYKPLFFNTIVPRGTILTGKSIYKKICSTWNKNMCADIYDQMFHVEQIEEQKYFYSMEKYVPRGTIRIYLLFLFIRSAFLFILIVGLFDHYFWDIQQGQLLFWSISGFLASTRMCVKNLTILQ